MWDLEYQPNSLEFILNSLLMMFEWAWHGHGSALGCPTAVEKARGQG